MCAGVCVCMRVCNNGIPTCYKISCPFGGKYNTTWTTPLIDDLVMKYMIAGCIETLII